MKIHLKQIPTEGLHLDGMKNALFLSWKRRESLRRTAALQPRSRRCRRGAVGKRITFAAGRAPLRIVSGKIRARDSGAGICGTHGPAWTGDGGSYAIHARGPFAESACASALRSRRRPSLQAEANRNCAARRAAQIGLERAG